MTLKAARINAGYTQQEAATKAGIDKSTLWKWEKGRTSPKATQLFELCSIYGCSVDDIFLNTRST